MIFVITGSLGGYILFERSSMSVIEQIPEKINALYKILRELEDLFPGRHFTPDGHLVGSIGEVLAEHEYNLELLPASAETHDAVSLCGRMVQIMATQGKSVDIRAEPEHLRTTGP